MPFSSQNPNGMKLFFSKEVDKQGAWLRISASMTRKTIVSHAEQTRLSERPDAHLLLVKPCRTSFDFEVIRFNSRAALEAFNRKANLSALVKTQVPLNCAIYRHESDSEARAKAQA